MSAAAHVCLADRHLVVSQGDHRIHARRAARRNPAKGPNQDVLRAFLRRLPTNGCAVGRYTRRMERDFRTELTAQVDAEQEKARSALNLWSAIYYLALFGSIVMAGMAALLPKLSSLGDGFAKQDLPSILAALAALLTTVMHAGSFERRVHATRVRHSNLRALRIQLGNPTANLLKISNRLSETISAYHRELLGSTSTDGASTTVDE
jgi:hypothetical protein